MIQDSIYNEMVRQRDYWKRRAERAEAERDEALRNLGMEYANYEAEREAWAVMKNAREAAEERAERAEAALPPNGWEQVGPLLGKQVIVRLGEDGTVAKGKLLGVADGGEVVVQDEMGFLHYCWPMLEIVEVIPPAEPPRNPMGDLGSSGYVKVIPPLAEPKRAPPYPGKAAVDALFDTPPAEPPEPLIHGDVYLWRDPRQIRLGDPTIVIRCPHDDHPCDRDPVCTDHCARVCPSCGSTDPKVRKVVWSDGFGDRKCRDEWHGVTT